MILHRNDNSSRLSIACVLFLLSLSLPTFSSQADENTISGGDEFLKGHRLQQKGQWAASIDHFRTAAGVYSLVADYALYQMAASAMKLDNTKLAISSLEKLLKSYPETPIKRAAQLELANLYCDAGKSSRAAPLIEAALPGTESTRDIVSLMFKLARIYFATNPAKSETLSWQLIHGWPSTREALDAVQMVRTIDTPEKRLAIAKVYYQNKNANEAITTLDKLIHDPNAASLMPELLLYKAESLALEGQKQAALALYNKIIDEYTISSSTAAALFNRAEYMRSLELSDEALADYARLIELFPDNDLAPKALRQRAIIFEKMGDPQEYVEYEKILERYPDRGLAYSAAMYGGVRLFQASDYARAYGFFQKLLNADLGVDANADAIFWSGKCLAAEGKAGSAKEAFSEVIRRFGDSYQAFRARALLKCLNTSGAIYTQPYRAGWQDLLVYRQIAFVSLEATTSEEAFVSVEKELPTWHHRAMPRLRFFMINHLPESKLELEHISQEVEKPRTKYALAWALFQQQAYYDSLWIATSLRDRISKPPEATRIHYLMYPVAYPELLMTSASKYSIDPMLSLAVMREESHFSERAISPSDACGLMQILPKTGMWLASELFGKAAFDKGDLFLPSVNVELGNYYLRYLLDKFDNNTTLAIAAYNWGETNLRNWLNGSSFDDFDVFVETIPAEETRKYVKKVLRSYVIYRSLYPADYLAHSTF